MPVVILSTKGQLVVPSELRARLGWKSGEALLVEQAGTDLIVRSSARSRSGSVDDLLGCLPYDGPPKTLAEMDAGIAIGARSTSPQGLPEDVG